MQESRVTYLDNIDGLNSYLRKNFSTSSSIIFVDSNVSSEYKFDENLNTHEILVNEETKNIRFFHFLTTYFQLLFLLLH